MTETPEHDLIRRAQAGDTDAVASLYRQHVAAITRYVGYRVADEAVVEDLTAEVFLQMVEGLPRYRITGAPFEAWLYRIARNLLIDNYRKENVKQIIPIDDIVNYPSGDDLDAKIDEKWSLEAIRLALNEIEPSQREVIELRFLVGLPMQEVALILEKTVAAVKALQHRGLNNLRTVIEEVETRSL